MGTLLGANEYFTKVIDKLLLDNGFNRFEVGEDMAYMANEIDIKPVVREIFVKGDACAVDLYLRISQKYIAAIPKLLKLFNSLDLSKFDNGTYVFRWSDWGSNKSSRLKNPATAAFYREVDMFELDLCVGIHYTMEEE